MDEGRLRPCVFIDFDNTITLGDVLDRVIERFSPTDEWREWESQWQAGEMGAAECLRRQMGGLRVTRAEIDAFMGEVEIDPGFAGLARWAAQSDVALAIVSDNFAPLIARILEHHRISGIPVMANELIFAPPGVEARFPLRDPKCPRCAHCKAQHLRRAAGRVRVYVGDGLSDLCAASIADIVFAKDALATELGRRRIPFHPFSSLAEVTRSLESRITARSTA